MATTFKQLLERYRFSSVLMKIIIINAAVFVALHLISIIMLFAGSANPDAVLGWIEMPSNPARLIMRPWTVITYMFAQYDTLHLLFNMLWLYWFGVIFLNLSSPARFVRLYFIGGLAGALLYLIAYTAVPLFRGSEGMLIGASGAVIAIVTATAIMAPDYKMYLLFLGGVSLKWVAIVTIGLDLIGVNGMNAGGHIAHLGGALAGAAYALMLRLPRRSPNIKRPQQPHTSPADARRELDTILDKIKKSGYSSLTAQERKRLFDVSSRIK